MAGSCIDKTLNDLVDVVAAGNCFVNPQNTNINNIAGAVYASRSGVEAAILALNPLLPGYSTKLTKLTNLKNSMISFAGNDLSGISSSTMGRFLSHTDFMSGKLNFFPTAQLGPYLSGIPNNYVIGTLTFASLLGVASSGLNVSSALCQTDPNSPCAAVGSVFGTVLGVFDAALLAMLAGFQAMTDFVNQVDAYIGQILAFVQTIEAQIIADLTSLVGMVLKALNYSMAKLLQALNVNPCFAPLISNIGSGALQAAIPPLS